MRIIEENGQYTLYKEQEAIGTAVLDGQAIRQFEIAPQWRGRGYGSYLLKEILRRGGGLDPKQATRFTAPLPCVRRWRPCAPAACWPQCSTAEKSSVMQRKRPRWHFSKACR